MALTAAHKQDIALFEAKSTEFQAYLKEHTDKPTDDSIKSARAMSTEINAIKTRIVNHVAQAGLASEVDGFKSFVDAPAGEANGGMKHIATTKSGETEIDVETKAVMNETGAGIFGAKTWDGIRDPSYKRAFGEYLRSGERMSAGAYKVLEVGIDPQGGFLAPPEMISRLIQRKATPTRLAGMVDVMTTGRDALIMPKVNYTGNPSDDPNVNIYSTGFRATWTEENPTSDTQSQVNDLNIFGTVRVDNFTNMIEGTLTNNMAEDPAFDVMGWFEGKFDETVNILEDDSIANGNGIQQPWGIIPYSVKFPSGAQGLIMLTSGAVGKILPDDVINLPYDIPEQYEDNIGFVFNKTGTLKYLRLLKDANNRYLFGQGYQDSGLSNGRPTDLAGYKYTLSGLMRDMPAGNPATYTSGQHPIICGDLKGYTLVRRMGLSIQVCRELLARRNQILLIGRVRFGGMPIEPWRMRTLKVQ